MKRVLDIEIFTVFRKKYTNRKLLCPLANARLEGYPILHVSDKFVRQMGYCKADVMRRPATLEFLQGEDTEPIFTIRMKV